MEKHLREVYISSSLVNLKINSLTPLYKTATNCQETNLTPFPALNDGSKILFKWKALFSDHQGTF